MDYLQKYQKYKLKYLNIKLLHENNNNQIGGNNKKELYLFKAEWCGHCRSFKEDWNKLQNNNDLKNKISFITMDSDLNQKEIKEWNIEGFPTIILKSGENAIEYNGKRNLDNIIDFINDN